MIWIAEGTSGSFPCPTDPGIESCKAGLANLQEPRQLWEKPIRIGIDGYWWLLAMAIGDGCVILCFAQGCPGRGSQSNHFVISCARPGVKEWQATRRSFMPPSLESTVTQIPTSGRPCLKCPIVNKMSDAVGNQQKHWLTETSCYYSPLMSVISYIMLLHRTLNELEANHIESLAIIHVYVILRTT